MWSAYIRCWVFSMGPSRDYVSGTEQNQASGRTGTRIEQVFGSQGRMIRLKIEYDQEIFEKKVLINPIVQSKPRYYWSCSHKQVTILSEPNFQRHLCRTKYNGYIATTWSCRSR
jgi:hypothetical protein